MTTAQNLDVTVDGDRIDARLYAPESAELTTEQGYPCIVMAHGLGCTQDSGLHEFATGLATTGTAVITFDYRHFAGSEGSPRQLIDPYKQLDDYRAVISVARATEGIDPARIVLWGVSFSGGHVIELAAEDSSIAGVIALVPSPDGRAAVLKSARSQSPVRLARTNALAIRDAIAGRRRKAPTYLPLVAPPGKIGALTAPGAFESMTTTAGPSWKNSFAARLLLQFAGYRPITKANKVQCPVLVQIGDLDQTAIPEVATDAALQMQARTHHYPCDHFDVFPGQEFYDRTLLDQQRFISDIFQGTPPAPPYRYVTASDTA